MSMKLYLITFVLEEQLDAFHEVVDMPFVPIEHIAGFEPAVVRKRLISCLGVVVITLKDFKVHTHCLVNVTMRENFGTPK